MKSKEPERSFPFLRVNKREGKPRNRGLTEIRGPYYSVVGRRYLEDLFEMMSAYVDSLKFAGGSFTLMPEQAVRDIINLCHKHDVLVSTGGFIERVLVQGDDSVRKYVAECKKLGFDIIEISAGFVSIPTDDWLRMIELVRKSGLKAKPEVGIQFGAGGATARDYRHSRGKRRVRQSQSFVWSDYAEGPPRPSAGEGTAIPFSRQKWQRASRCGE